MAQASDIHTYADYSSYIYVHNKTSTDLLLNESGADEGDWAKGSPANTIESGTDKVIHLKDNFGFNGSKGFVEYELYTPKNKRVTVRLDFADPYSASDDNYLNAKSSKPNLVSVNVLDYQKKGHPFTAHVEVYLAGDDDHSDNVEAQFKIGFDSVGGLLHWQPVHEEIAIAAFIRAIRPVLPKGTTYNNLDPKQWEYVRGLVWPDDPSCLLFKNYKDKNHEFDLGDDFLAEFKNGKKTCMTQRSHFGDLQLLHGMASNVDEDPNETKRNILAWIEVMYKLAVGKEITERDLLREKLPRSFSASTSGDQTLRDLLIGTTPDYRKIDISRRALGVCLHMIQDSYAVGHTLRRLKNPHDLAGRDSDGYVHFKPGTYAQLGPLITFHTYRGQSKRHDHYDDSDDERNPKDLETFNKIIGARDAIEKCTKLINFYLSNTKWDDGVRAFLDNEVYKLDQNVTRSNIQVDERFGMPDTAGVAATAAEEDEQYRAGMERKMLLLEGGLAYAQPQPSAKWYAVSSLHGRILGALKYCLVIALIVLAFIFFKVSPRF